MRALSLSHAVRAALLGVIVALSISGLWWVLLGFLLFYAFLFVGVEAVFFALVIDLWYAPVGGLSGVATGAVIVMLLIAHWLHARLRF